MDLHPNSCALCAIISRCRGRYFHAGTPAFVPFVLVSWFFLNIIYFLNGLNLRFCGLFWTFFIVSLLQNDKKKCGNMFFTRFVTRRIRKFLVTRFSQLANFIFFFYRTNFHSVNLDFETLCPPRRFPGLSKRFSEILKSYIKYFDKFRTFENSALWFSAFRNRITVTVSITSFLPSGGRIEASWALKNKFFNLKTNFRCR